MSCDLLVCINSRVLAMGASRILRVQSVSVSKKRSKIEKRRHHIRTIYGGE